MKTILIEIDAACARDLERVAPVKKRMRSEFIRLAIRRAIDLALDRATEQAYRGDPFPDGLLAEDLEGWDERNELARSARSRKTASEGTAPRKAAARKRDARNPKRAA